MNDKSLNLDVFFENQLDLPDPIDTEDISELSSVCESFLEELISHELEDFQIFNLNLLLVDQTQIQEINKNYRNKDKATDVLSFPQYEDLRGGSYQILAPEEELGDIIICYDVCRTQAQEHSLSFREEFLHLAVHGFLHICGYDHEISENEEKIMEELEEKLLLSMKKKKSRD